MSFSYSKIYPDDAIFECVFSHIPSMTTHFVDNVFNIPKEYLCLPTYWYLATYIVYMLCSL